MSLPVEVLKRYEKWKDIISISGPESLGAIRGFRDEALRGQWKGFRASRSGLKYRVIYKIEASEILVKVIDVSAGESVRIIRELQGMSQNDLAKA